MNRGCLAVPPNLTMMRSINGQDNESSPRRLLDGCPAETRQAGVPASRWELRSKLPGDAVTILAF